MLWCFIALAVAGLAASYIPTAEQADSIGELWEAMWNPIEPLPPKNEHPWPWEKNSRSQY